MLYDDYEGINHDFGRDEPREIRDMMFDFATEDEFREYASLVNTVPPDELEEFGIPRRRLRYAYQAYRLWDMRSKKVTL